MTIYARSKINNFWFIWALSKDKLILAKREIYGCGEVVFLKKKKTFPEPICATEAGGNVASDLGLGGGFRFARYSGFLHHID